MPADLQGGLNKLRTGVLIHIVGALLWTGAIIVAWIGLAAFSAYQSVAVPCTGIGCPTPATALPNFPIAALVALIAVLASGAGITFVGFWFVRSGFKMLEPSMSTLGTGALGASLQIAGVLAVAVTAVLLVVAVILSGMSSTSSAGQGLSGTIAFIAGLGVIVIGAVIWFVGIILVLIGFYRIGNTYNNNLVEIGAIMYLFMGFIGAILLFIGLSEVKDSIAKGGTKAKR